MTVRRYESADCAVLAKLFYDTVHAVSVHDYTEEQLNAWASGTVDLSQWDSSLSRHFSLVAEENGVIIGFGDIDESGYLDRLYVHKDYQRRGIASTLCDRLERAYPVDKISAHASITAKPFFLSRGYEPIKEQQVCRAGILLTNFVMEKQL